jgi:hypothetical protein
LQDGGLSEAERKFLSEWIDHPIVERTWRTIQNNMYKHRDLWMDGPASDAQAFFVHVDRWIIPQPVPHEGSRVAGVLLAGTALILAGVGLLTNAQFAASLGQTPVASSLLAALGFAIDALALILPCTASVLWRGRHRLASVSAWAVWAGAVTVTLIASVGFAAGNIGDSVTARGAKITERAELTSRIATLEERHTQAIAAAERARAAECGHVGPICRQRELADPEIDLRAATTALAALPAIVAGDPAGESQNKVSWSSKWEIRLSGLVSAQKSGLFAVGMNASLFAAKNSNGFSEQTISGHSIAGRS